MDLDVLNKMLMSRFPKMMKHLKNLGAEPQWLCTDWFLSLFSTSFPMPVVLRIWDSLFLEGEVMLFKIGIGVFKICQSQLIKTEFLDEVLKILKHDFSTPHTFPLTLKKFISVAHTQTNVKHSEITHHRANYIKQQQQNTNT